MIRNYIGSDIAEITKLGSFLHKNYKFKLDVFSKCLEIGRASCRERV